MNIKITPKSIFRILMVTIIILILADIAGFLCKFYLNLHYVNGFFRLFDLDQETNIPSYFSDLILLASSLLLFFIAYTNRGKKDYFQWLGLAIIFVFLSVDEAAMIHEMLIGIFRRTYHLSGLLYNAWVIPFGIAMIAGLFIYVPFLIRLPQKTMILIVVSGIIYVGGAMFIEMFEGKYEAIHGTQNLAYSVYVLFEEFCEMFGISLFIYALLRHISLTSNNLTLTVIQKKIMVPEDGQMVDKRD